jgi:hypothetical protein
MAAVYDAVVLLLVVLILGGIYLHLHNEHKRESQMPAVITVQTINGRHVPIPQTPTGDRLVKHLRLDKPVPLRQSKLHLSARHVNPAYIPLLTASNDSPGSVYVASEAGLQGRKPYVPMLLTAVSLVRETVYAVVDTGSGSFVTPAKAACSNAIRGTASYGMGPASGDYCAVPIQLENNLGALTVMALVDVTWDVARNRGYAASASILGLSPVPDIAFANPQNAVPFIKSYGEQPVVALQLSNLSQPTMRLGVALPAPESSRTLSMIRTGVLQYYASLLASTVTYLLGGHTVATLTDVPVILDTGTTVATQPVPFGNTGMAAPGNLSGQTIQYDGLRIESQGAVILCDAASPNQVYYGSAAVNTVVLQRDATALIVGLNSLTGFDWIIDYGHRLVTVSAPAGGTSRVY